MRASATAGESTYAGIVRLVTAAQTAKAPFIRLADRYALLLLPATLFVAAAAFFGSGDPIRALAVLVASTPCPLTSPLPSPSSPAFRRRPATAFWSRAAGRWKRSRERVP